MQLICIKEFIVILLIETTKTGRELALLMNANDPIQKYANALKYIAV